jgi:hypothetical protein
MTGRSKSDKTAFVKRVLALYAAAIDGATDTHVENDRDIRAVAFGLAAITQAINDRKAKYGNDRLLEAGVFQASDIIEAIIGGYPLALRIRRCPTGLSGTLPCSAFRPANTGCSLPSP